MNLRIALCALACIALAAALAGCTQTTPVATPAPTQAATPTAEATVIATPTATPVPYDIVPATQGVTFTVEKDRVYNKITLTFTGGPGQILVQKVWMTVTKADGTTDTGTMNFSTGSHIAQGDNLVMEGSRGTDRAEVFATLNGKDYKVKDVTLAGQDYYKR